MLGRSSPILEQRSSLPAPTRYHGETTDSTWRSQDWYSMSCRIPARPSRRFASVCARAERSPRTSGITRMGWSSCDCSGTKPLTWVKGFVSEKRVRIWNMWAGTSCGGYFRRLGPGAQAVFALTPALEMRRQVPELWELLNMSASPADFELTTTCAETLRVLQWAVDLQKYVGKRIQ